MSQKIHTTIGVYPDLSFKMNGVSEDLLEQHVQYNRENRPGRALFVDSKCVLKGGLSEEQIIIHEQLFKAEKYKMNKDTRPYV